MTILIIKILAMTTLCAGGALALKQYGDTQSLYAFTLSLSLYMAGTAVLGELLRSGQPLGQTIILASILQLVIVQIASVFLYGEPFRLGPIALALLAVFFLMQPVKDN